MSVIDISDDCRSGTNKEIKNNENFSSTKNTPLIGYKDEMIAIHDEDDIIIISSSSDDEKIVAQNAPTSIKTSTTIYSSEESDSSGDDSDAELLIEEYIDVLTGFEQRNDPEKWSSDEVTISTGYTTTSSSTSGHNDDVEMHQEPDMQDGEHYESESHVSLHESSIDLSNSHDDPPRSYFEVQKESTDSNHDADEELDNTKIDPRPTNMI